MRSEVKITWWSVATGPAVTFVPNGHPIATSMAATQRIKIEVPR